MFLEQWLILLFTLCRPEVLSKEPFCPPICRLSELMSARIVGTDTSLLTAVHMTEGVGWSSPHTSTTLTQINPSV